MSRVAIVAGCWFLLWICGSALAGGLFAYLTAGPGGPHGAVGTNAFLWGIVGLVLAVVASFGWPLLMPKAIKNWMAPRRADDDTL